MLLHTRTIPHGGEGGHGRKPEPRHTRGELNECHGVFVVGAITKGGVTTGSGFKELGYMTLYSASKDRVEI